MLSSFLKVRVVSETPMDKELILDWILTILREIWLALLQAL